jgi:hypothetical protein
MLISKNIVGVIPSIITLDIILADEKGLYLL